MKLDGKKKYTEVLISRYHPSFKKDGGKSGISKHLGFPLLLKRILLNPNWRMKMVKLPRNEQFSPLENTEALCLMIDVEATSKHWRFAPNLWDKGLDPTVLVARRDMKDITAKQIEVLCDLSATLRPGTT